MDIVFRKASAKNATSSKVLYIARRADCAREISNRCINGCLMMSGTVGNALHIEQCPDIVCVNTLNHERKHPCFIRGRANGPQAVWQRREVDGFPESTCFPKQRYSLSRIPEGNQ